MNGINSINASQTREFCSSNVDNDKEEFRNWISSMKISGMTEEALSQIVDKRTVVIAMVKQGNQKKLLNAIHSYGLEDEVGKDELEAVLVQKYTATQETAPKGL